MNNTDLTPITEYEGVLLKRDDLYMNNIVSGGKVRQCEFLFDKYKKEIEEVYKGRVVCATHLKSPQPAIMSEIAKQRGYECNVVCYGSKVPNVQLSIAQSNGANIYGCKSPYRNTHEWIIKQSFGDCYFVRMGFVDEAIINATMIQVQNIPDDLDLLILPIGSGINAVSVLKGIEKYKKNVKEVVGVWVGKNREYLFKDFFGLNFKDKIKLVQASVEYSKEIVVDNYYFDPIYEAKAWDWWLTNKGNYEGKKVGFWVVGNRTYNYPTEEIVYKDHKTRINTSKLFIKH